MITIAGHDLVTLVQVGSSDGERWSLRLICYPTGSVQPTIRAAPVSRRWMDGLPMEFGYRCLPLNMANAYGWEILCPTRYEVCWNGEQTKDAVTVTAVGEPEFRPTSHFGSGIVTFHTGYLFETEPGYNLVVSGPANQRKHGITPLTGIVETDWSPYSFTMNWAITAPGQTIVFEPGEPFCTFFPVKRGVLEEFEPEIRSLDSVPEKQQQHDAWQQSRRDFIIDLPKAGTEANDSRWQKSYYRGFLPDGSPAPADHQTKLRLKPFKDHTDVNNDE